MAQRGDELARKKLCCFICRDLMKDPVLIPCGHSYCMGCIKKHWDEEDQKGIHSCPQCRKTFRPRPTLVKNTMLADLVEELRKPRLPVALADPCYAGPEDVGCDVCTGRKRKALKSGLQCRVSYCEQHIQLHHDVPAKKHRLVEAAKLQENICTQHNEVKNIFCHSDKQCICFKCLMNEHKGHNTVEASTEMTKRQVELGKRQQENKQRIQSQEKDAEALQQEVEVLICSADSAVEASEEISAELIRVITKRSSAVTRKIRSQQETEMSRATELQEKLQREITILKRRDADLEQLSDTEDPTQFLLKYASMPRPTSSPALPNLNRRPLRHFDHVTASVSEAGEKLKASYREEWNKVSETVAEVDILLPQDPKTRAEFLQYAQPVKNLKMDRNTASIQLVLSEGDRKVTKIRDPQSYADHADRFMSRSQALCKTGLTGRHYWEVEWSGLGVSIAVAYRDIARTGNISTFGDNVKSWALECLVKDTQILYNSKHNSNNHKRLIQPPKSSIGVFLDHKAGNLSFYRISDTITLLHKVQTKFSQPLYAGLGVYYFGSMAELCDAKSQSGGFPRETAAV
ncbi:LOW QUALITY PROTEIN: tripartite motif-containing protein 16-like [Cyclopterus lumpus]|uniref:LOW QUALITY PROTEIN: tripartite motif-containing protein 16-like n=1 Tax=Cyclopterus lumpus TaxID=8103 RepID=UPI001486FEC5|nr:LOW QUALITY PROTEIN: tripartite motif-containing protein 16-like [Cyclopterus lumpus]